MDKKIEEIKRLVREASAELQDFPHLKSTSEAMIQKWDRPNELRVGLMVRALDKMKASQTLSDLCGIRIKAESIKDSWFTGTIASKEDPADMRRKIADALYTKGIDADKYGLFVETK